MTRTILIALAFALTLGMASTTAVNANPPMDNHPQMKKALHELENAKMHLEKAASDFGGHRIKAIEHTNEAIREIREALKPHPGRP